MDNGRAFSRKSFISIFLVIVLLLALVDAAFYFGMNTMFSKITISMKAGGNTIQMTGLLQKIDEMDYLLRVFFIPASAVIFLLLGLFLWLYLKSAVNKLAASKKPGVKTTEKADPDQLAAEKRKKEQHDRKLFVHLLSVLQREGRLVDFFAENLDDYDDAQIGAAVRNIHENCKKIIDKYIKLKAVIEQDEGNEVVVEPGFDPNTVKLVGNVAGDPPFKGILRHRGWQVTKLDLPKLSDAGDLHAISPAEVEIQ